MSSLEDLKSQLAEYEEQLEGIEALLAEDAENEEYVALKVSTLELVSDLQKLIASASSPAKPAVSSADTSSIGAIASNDATDVSSQSDSKVASAKENQVELALKKGLYVGLPSEAVWSGDGLWYPAVIQAITEDGIRVQFKSYGDVETLEAKNVRAASALTSSVSRGANSAAPASSTSLDPSQSKKRKEPTHGGSGEGPHSDTPESVDSALPENIRFAETDTEKVREWKKRQQKSWKAERRREKQEIAENQAKVSWQNFSKSMKKSGFGVKRESMFRTIEGVNSKVGVVNKPKILPGRSGSPATSVGAPRYTAAKATSSSSAPSDGSVPYYDPLAAPAYYIPGAQHYPQR